MLHFAALSLVGESMREPMRYMIENAAAGFRLIEACVRHGVRQVRAVVDRQPVRRARRDADYRKRRRIQPGSPYGESKLMIERALYWAEQVHGLRSACLRYFNAAGADPEGALGEDHDPETHLIPLAIDAALGRRPKLVVFGTDYPTPDGTAIRDYVHVNDLGQAHLLALAQLEQGSVTYNLGNGAGHSVQDVIACGRARAGPARCRANTGRGGPATRRCWSRPPQRIRAETGWTPRYAALDDIVRTAADWRLRQPKGTVTGFARRVRTDDRQPMRSSGRGKAGMAR